MQNYFSCTISASGGYPLTFHGTTWIVGLLTPSFRSKWISWWLVPGADRPPFFTVPLYYLLFETLDTLSSNSHEAPTVTYYLCTRPFSPCFRFPQTSIRATLVLHRLSHTSYFFILSFRPWLLQSTMTDLPGRLPDSFVLLSNTYVHVALNFSHFLTICTN